MWQYLRLLCYSRSEFDFTYKTPISVRPRFPSTIGMCGIDFLLRSSLGLVFETNSDTVRNESIFV